MTTFCVRAEVDPDGRCPNQCRECAAFSAPFWAKRPAYPAYVPAILHLIADPADQHAACGAEPWTRERWKPASAGVKCGACTKIEGAGE